MCDNERNVYGESNDKRVSHFSVCGIVRRIIITLVAVLCCRFVDALGCYGCVTL